MACPDAREILLRMEDLPDGPRRRELARHLATCARCREVARDHGHLARSLTLVFPGEPVSQDPGCITPEELLDLTRERVLGEAAEQLRAHIAACGHCAGAAATMALATDTPLPADDELLVEAMAAASRLPRGEHGPRRVRTAVGPVPARARRWAAALAMAASLGGLAVLVGGLPPREPRGDSPAPVRAGTRAGALAPSLLAPREGEQLRQAGLELEWQAVAEARSYTVTVLDGRGATVWEATTKATSLRLPADAGLAPGTRYFAWVSAELGDGRSVASPAVGFTSHGSTP